MFLVSYNAVPAERVSYEFLMPTMYLYKIYSKVITCLIASVCFLPSRVEQAGQRLSGAHGSVSSLPILSFTPQQLFPIPSLLAHA